MSALVALLDVTRDRRGVLSSHNKVPSLFLAGVNALIAIAQDDTIARPQLVRANAAKIAQDNLALFDERPVFLEDAVQRLVAAEAGTVRELGAESLQHVNAHAVVSPDAAPYERGPVVVGEVCP